MTEMPNVSFREEVWPEFLSDNAPESGRSTSGAAMRHPARQSCPRRHQSVSAPMRMGIAVSASPSPKTAVICRRAPSPNR